MKKIAIVSISSFLLICMGYIYSCMKPIVLFDRLQAENVFVSDSIYNPIDTFDFTRGKNLIILYTNYEEIPFLSENMNKWTLLKCKDNKIIELTKKNFEFKRISKDHVGTTASGSKIFFVKNDEIVFESDIIIEGDNVALYFENAGWTSATKSSELVCFFSSFSPVYFPVILMNGHTMFR